MLPLVNETSTPRNGTLAKECELVNLIVGLLLLR